MSCNMAWLWLVADGNLSEGELTCLKGGGLKKGGIVLSSRILLLFKGQNRSCWAVLYITCKLGVFFIEGGGE
jgi:hypothetical protein